MEQYYRFGKTINLLRKDNHVPVAELIDGIMSKSEYYRYTKNEVDIAFPKLIAMLNKLEISHHDLVMWAKMLDEDFLTSPYNEYENFMQTTTKYLAGQEVDNTLLYERLVATIKKDNLKQTRLVYYAIKMLDLDFKLDTTQQMKQHEVDEFMADGLITVNEVMDYLMTNFEWRRLELELYGFTVRFMSSEMLGAIAFRFANYPVAQIVEPELFAFNYIILYFTSISTEQGNDKNLKIRVFEELLRVYSDDLRQTSFLATQVKIWKIKVDGLKHGKVNAHDLNEYKQYYAYLPAAPEESGNLLEWSKSYE